MGKYRREQKNKTFEKQMMDAGRIPNIAAALIVSLYTLYFAGIPFNTLGPQKTAGLGLFACFIIIVLQFGVAPRTNHFLTAKITQLLDRGENGGLPAAERTGLVEKLMRCPSAICIQVVLVFVLGIGCWIISFYLLFGIDFSVTVFSFIACLFGAFNAGVLAYTYAERLCSHYAMKLVAEGVDDSVVGKKHFFGPGIKRLVILHCIIPAALSNILQFFIVWKIYQTDIYRENQALNAALIVILNTVLDILLSGLLYRQVTGSIQRITTILEKMNTGTLSQGGFLPTDLGDETAYSLYLVNGIIRRLRAITDDAEATGRSVLSSMQELSVTSKETAATSVEQAAGVKECVATMEDAESLSHTISGRISNVATAAKTAATNTEESFSVLSGNMQKMTEITEANLETITGIKSLSEKIENVWSIVNVINTIADKTRIIAFNAELEASTAGQGGRNFHIIANEIRRLAESISVSTHEIRNRITEIQHSSDNLIIASEGGTGKIREGSELFSALEEKFKGIRTSSEITAESAAEIQQIIDEQAASFVQIVTTLQQISAGVDNFSAATQTISTSAENLRQITAELETIQLQSAGGEK
ncbi:MAG: methyl-accepting chemotaxis protein [Treponema sp.]|nr:methyl-accepting chemotaxis protein [Treponema sp.]